ncbi:CoA transferase [Cupriavidus basilensis]
MHTLAEWGHASAGKGPSTSDPLLHWTTCAPRAGRTGPLRRTAPLRGIRVLDLTRILAGPVATRFLAGFGADVLRIDPRLAGKSPARFRKSCPASVVPGSTLKNAADRHVLGAAAEPGRRTRARLPARGPGASWPGRRRRREINPGLVDVSLDAYGWSGPWTGRRGFDSLVQMSTGIRRCGHARLRGWTAPGRCPCRRSITRLAT